MNQPEPSGYAEAVTELEAILAEIESADVDVDVLATKVQRANVLIEFCRARITAAEDAVANAPSGSEGSEPAGPDSDL